MRRATVLQWRHAQLFLTSSRATILVECTPSVEVGPGGIRVDPDRRRDYYRDRRDYRGGRRCRTEYTT